MTREARYPQDAGEPVQLHTYLNYGGNCEEAFKFYEKHLDGKITMLMRHGEQPGNVDVSPEWKRAVLHARMNIGGTELLGADIPPDRFQPIRTPTCPSRSAVIRKLNVSMRCCRTAGRFSCRWSKRSSPNASLLSQTGPPTSYDCSRPWLGATGSMR